MNIEFINAGAPNDQDEQEYYTECDNKECGHYYKIGKIGETCELCMCGTMQPMQVEPECWDCDYEEE